MFNAFPSKEAKSYLLQEIFANDVLLDYIVDLGGQGCPGDYTNIRLWLQLSWHGIFGNGSQPIREAYLYGIERNVKLIQTFFEFFHTNTDRIHTVFLKKIEPEDNFLLKVLKCALEHPELINPIIDVLQQNNFSDPNIVRDKFVEVFGDRGADAILENYNPLVNKCHQVATFKSVG